MKENNLLGTMLLTPLSQHCLLKYVSILLCFTFFGLKAKAVEEPYINELKGAQLTPGNFFYVTDEKFLSAAAWSSIDHTISVDNMISFELNFDTSLHFYGKPFTSTLTFTLYLYKNPASPEEITDSITHRNIALNLRYDTISGKPYKGIATYKFQGAHKYKVLINSIQSQQLNPLLPIFRVKGQIIVNRKYKFEEVSSDATRFSVVNGNQLQLHWEPSKYPGAESFDVEYTHVDDSSLIGKRLDGFRNGAVYNVPADTLAKWFRNNSTRISTTAASYQINVPYDKGFILFRVRGVQLHYPDEVRWEGEWNYKATPGLSACTTGCPSGVAAIVAHEAGLNWQYSATFAEEGKRKEVLSYFDGTLHNRQAVTLSNSENRAIVQETIYDVLGRPAVNILPAPVKDSTLHYFRNFNRNMAGVPYSFSDFNTLNCVSDAKELSPLSGASQYYSEQNPFLSDYTQSRYIPNAGGLPLTVTEYTTDNTGRIKAQGGVGPQFQLNKGHETKYFYGQARQTELDRLFGSEAGNASRYLKNMVIDPNGQISVSYVEAGGKTIATALAGKVPNSVHALSSSVGASTVVTNEVMRPEDFSRNAGDYTVSATSTFLAPVTGTYTFHYKVDPLKLEVLFGQNKDSLICNTCYYDLEIRVSDDCNNTLDSVIRPTGNVFDTSCTQAITLEDSLHVSIAKVGEYYVSYGLRVSRDGLNYYDSVHLKKNTDIRTFSSFLLDELKETDFTGCFSNCQTCEDDLGTKEEFFVKFRSLYLRDSVVFRPEDSLWVYDLHASLLARCRSLQPLCKTSVCDEKLQLLKIDVTPGGQYALYDSSYGLVEPQINVLALRDSVSVFRDEAGNPAFVTLQTVNGEDSTVSVKSLSDSLFIAHWNDAWADSLVRFHPEYCYYLWCVANSNSYEFDEEVRNWLDVDSVRSKGWFNPTDYAALLKKDPFFNTIEGVTGNGAKFFSRMQDSLRLYSRMLVRLGQADKNILEVIDISLYCKQQANGWDACQPDSACRSRSREWELYKQWYLNLKQRFYEEARRTSSDPTFSGCTNCYVGRDLLQSLSPSPQCDSLQRIVEDFKQLRTPVSSGQIAGNKKITSCAYEVINAANALMEARKTYPNPTFSQDYCWDSSPISVAGKLHAVKRNTNNNLFHAIVPLSLSCTQDVYPELRDTAVLPADFCKGTATQAQLDDKYYAVTMGEEGNKFRLIWSKKDYGAYAYYGTSSPVWKFLPTETCSNCENHVFELGFIRMPNMSYTHESYNQIRVQQPFIPFDSILRVKDLRFATEALPANYSTIADNDFSSYLKVTLDLIDGTSIEAHIRSNYDGTIYIKYKQSLNGSIYDDNCQNAFAAYFNQQKGTNYTSNQIDSLFRMSCGEPPLACLSTSNDSFSIADSTCSNTCPDGIYTPSDRPGSSLSIIRGQSNVSPSNVPAGYNNSQFYTVFNLKTGPNTCCQFFNVWVSIDDSTCSESPGGYRCGTSLNGNYNAGGYYAYPGHAINTNHVVNGAMVNVTCDAIEYPNRFTIYDNNNHLIATTEWIGYATYSGPWGASLNTSTSQILSFAKQASSYILKVETSTPQSVSDSWNVSISCTESVGGDTCKSVVFYPSSCANDSLVALYQGKIRRYPEYVNPEAFVNKVLSSNPQQLSEEKMFVALDQCKSNCEAQADVWTKTLSRCTVDNAKLLQLKQAFIDICSKGCSIERPFGTSTLPSTILATYHSFEEAIIGILGAGAVNDTCTADLLSEPYPHDLQPWYTERLIMESDSAICQKISLYETAWQASGFPGSFYQYLQSHYGTNGTAIMDSLGQVMSNGFTGGQSYTVSAQPAQPAVDSFATVTTLTPILSGVDTQNKPQAKAWYYAGKWWCVVPAANDGTKIFRLDGTTWTPVLKILSSGSRADCRVVGDKVHILLFKGASNNSYLISVEYDPAATTYKLWNQRPSSVALLLPAGSVTATLAVDGSGRMWVANDDSSSISVRWSDAPYSTWSTPITLATGLTNSDMCAITSMPGKIGVFWSNQNTKRFGFKTHADGSSPTSWSADEIPASQSALNVEGGMANDHMNLKAASDGTLYCAVKTNYGLRGFPLLALLVRRPSGSWDSLYTVSIYEDDATQPIVVLNETIKKLKVIYTSKSGGGDIQYKESSTVQISFGAAKTLMSGGSNLYNYATSTHQSYQPDLVVLATNISATPYQTVGVLATDNTVLDQSPPSVVSINRLLPINEATSMAQVTFRAIFSEKVFGVDASDFTVGIVSGTANGIVSSVAAVGTDGFTYDITISSITGLGTLRLDLKESGTGITDAFGNALGGGFRSWEYYTVITPDPAQAGNGFSTITPLNSISSGTNTQYKPQAKAWYYAGKWWCVVPQASNGTWIFRLDNTNWTPVLKILSSSSRADTWVSGDLVHMLLFKGASSSSYIVSAQYDVPSQSYKLWSQRPSSTTLVFPGGTETATLALDGNGRMWVASDDSSSVFVRWSDAPYTTWSAPVTIASGISEGDLCAVTKLPGKVGVFWSNKNTKRFGFRVHADGSDPNSWSSDEVPASQSALNVGGGMADDHVNVTVSSNGTLYCAVKTSYATPGYPRLALLVRQPSGNWDNLYQVTDNVGTQPVVLLNEELGRVKVVYTSTDGGGDLLYREASTVNLSFGPTKTLMSGGSNLYHYATSTHQTYHPEIVVLGSNTSTTPVQTISILGKDGAPAGAAPYVLSSNRWSSGSAVTNATTLTYRVVFSKKVTGVDPTDFALTALSGTVQGVLASNAVTAVGADSTTFDVTVSNISGYGALRLDVKVGGTGYTGGGYDLDSTVVADLQKSCGQCNGILRENVVLPALFDPKAAGCQTNTAVRDALAAFAAKYPGVDSTKDHYTLLLTNFLNHRFGFSLYYSDYEAFLIKSGAGSTALLCNKPKLEEVVVDPTGSCTADLFATALTNAYNRYVVYIDSVRTEFRNAYMTKCLSVVPRLKMSASLYEYHYTLYYYDQSGNLVKTVPPEGVTLLNEQQLETVRQYRLLQSEGCYQYSDSILFNGNGYVQYPAGSVYNHTPFTVETRALLSNYSDQVLLSQIQETTTGETATPLVHTGYSVAVVNNKVQLSLYGYSRDSLYRQHSAVALSVLPVQSILPSGGWQYLAVQYTGEKAAPWKLIINGNSVALQYIVNTLIDDMAYTAAAGLVVGANLDSHTGPSAKLQGALKNLRVYNRLLSIGELRQNAYNNCQLPAHTAGLIFWSPLNDASGNQVNEMYSTSKGSLVGFTWQPFTGSCPAHNLVTTYQYNSLNQVVQQYSPDGDTTYFWYDRLGRLIASQNKEQETTASYSGSNKRFSYTRYDDLGRITEVGEKSGATDIRTLDLIDSTKIQEVRDWLASATNRQVNKTIYDEPVNPLQTMGTSRKRVTASIYLENAMDAEGDSTLYGYDLSGNVKTLVQHIKALVTADPSNGKKQIDYDFDLVSGKVNRVNYQRGRGDQFFYKYLYDADNRVIRSLSSRDALLWMEDASYNYYLHGPLARTELGNWKAQGVDYAYTLQGWLKGINGETLSAATEMVGDGKSGSLFSRVARDVYGYKLGYFTGDYSPIGGTGAPAFSSQAYTAPQALEATGNQLFNGNISYTTLALSKMNAGATMGYTYGYDQLNRLVQMRQHTVTGAWSNTSIQSAYSESIGYDANGNILKYLRRGVGMGGQPLDMDSLGYQYSRDGGGRLLNNRLNHVRDAISATNYSVDIDNQSVDNYSYDRIGNLKKDVAEGITGIDWTVYGKIKTITKGASPITYHYDAGGNRTVKEVTTGGVLQKTFYVRDAQGNTLAVYSQQGTSALRWDEQHLYGSSRLGMWRWDTLVPTAAPVVTGTSLYDSVLVGSRIFELSNHLGNVLSTISDKKVGHDSSGVVDYYTAEVLSQQDYYPFGMGMPGRQFTVGSSYRYGFNGKENDNEVKGADKHVDYGMRVYDPRLGRFLSVDPISKNYPALTPYQYASNRPIDGIDLEGLEYITFHVKVTRAANGKPMFSIFYKEDYRGMSAEAMATIHKKADYAKNFYELYSESFGSEGRGFKWVYFDEKGSQLGEPVWQMKQSKSMYFNGGNSGYYSGAGSITKYGPGLSDGTFSELSNDYDFRYSPMSYADAISKRHDMMQEKEIVQPQGWLEDVRTMKSDRILLSDAQRGLLFKETKSQEDFIRTTNITIFFSAVIRYKEWKGQKMQALNLDVNSAQDQRKVIFSDWKPAFLSKDWYAKQLLRLSGGGAKESERNTVKPVANKSP